MTDAIQALEAIEKATSRTPETDNLIHLSTGVVLRGRKVSASLLIEVLTSSRRPKPPVYRNEKMGRMMENLDDPDYIEQVQAYKYEQAGAMVTAMISQGTEIVSIPDGMQGPHPSGGKWEVEAGKKRRSGKPDWPEWIGEYELLGLPMNAENAAWRYLTWVKFKAAPGDDDLKLIQEVVGRLSGVREADAQAAEDFPGRNEKNR